MAKKRENVIDEQTESPSSSTSAGSTSPAIVVPEELFNLTQLANVTLAAGKLSTNNHDKIKEFIQNESSELPTEQLISDPSLANQRIRMCVDTYLKSFGDVKKNDNAVIRPSTSPPPLTPSLPPPTTTDCRVFNSYGTQQRYHHHHHHHNQNHMNSSSSEDDSNYTNYYAHKVFDKRKTRKLSYQSDDSEFLRTERRLEHTTDDSLQSSETESMDSKSIIRDGGSGVVGMVDDGEDDIHICPECGKKYSTSSNLARHRQTHR